MADPFRFFTADELRCRDGCGAGWEHMHPGFMGMLSKMRRDLAFPLPVISAYRCPAHDAAVGGKGPHTTGRAVDIRVSGERAYRLVQAAIQYGFYGIGISQKGHLAKRFIHLDTLTATDGYPRPRIWTY